MKEFDLVVIGASASGISAALAAADLGVSVALVDQGKFDSTDAAQQALVQAARVYRTCQGATEFGIRTENTRILWNALKLRIADVCDEIDALRRQKLKSAGVELIQGSARFEDQSTLHLQTKSSNEERVRAEKFILAIDSKAEAPQAELFSEIKVLSPQHLFTLPTFPRSLVVIGHNAAACELAQGFALLGSKVTLLSSASRLLPEIDADLSAFCEKILVQEGITLHLNVLLQSATNGEEKTTIEFESDGQTHAVTASEILFLPEEESTFPELNLAAAEVELKSSESSPRLPADEYLQLTSNLWICGTSHNDFEIAAQNALSLSGKRKSREMSECVVFTTPEIATIGLSEAQAQEKVGDINIYTQKFSESERAIIESETRGFLKLITDSDGDVMGAHLASPDATTLIHQFATAVQERT